MIVYTLKHLNFILSFCINRNGRRNPPSRGKPERPLTSFDLSNPQVSQTRQFNLPFTLWILHHLPVQTIKSQSESCTSRLLKYHWIISVSMTPPFAIKEIDVVAFLASLTFVPDNDAHDGMFPHWKQPTDIWNHWSLRHKDTALQNWPFCTL